MRRREDGFTMVEVLVALVVMAIGLLGVMSMHLTTVKANRISQRLDRAALIAEQTMEQERQALPATLTPGVFPKPAVTTAEGVTYTPTVTHDGGGSAGLCRITVEVTFGDEDDAADLHTARLQMIRTTTELL
jgi:prepilin-type N-terminal cleavage/methylation domain-containing protein